MTRARKLSREETFSRRRELAERAAAGDLRLPGAILKMRMALGLTQGQFAQLCGVARRQVAEMEQGKANPTLEVLQRMAAPFSFDLALVPRKET